jgi:lipid-binding SYLF domain-containing protein
MVQSVALWLLAGASLFLIGQEDAARKPETAAAPGRSGEVVNRIEEAGEVFSEIMAAPDNAIPREILERAHCIGIVPSMKRAGFVVGGRYGKGVLTCRTNGAWSGPSTIRIEGGSFGAQIGAGETDVVLVVLNERGAEKLMGNEFTIGGDAAAMAGPVGREAAAKTDALMNAQMLSYSRSRGLFAGVTLNGATLRSDDDDNAKLYGQPVSHKEILLGKVRPPAAAAPLYTSLKQHLPGAAGEASRHKK